MEDSGLKPRPQETIPVVPVVPQVEVKPPTPPSNKVTNIAKETLLQASNSDTERIVKERDYSVMPEPGFFNALVRLWQKYCERPNSEEENLYKVISSKTTELENDLNTVEGSIRDMQRTEKKVSGVSQKTYDLTLEKSNNVKGNLARANATLEKLQSQFGPNIKTLSDKPRYEDLKITVEKLQERINYLEGRTTVSDKLLEIENQILSYKKLEDKGGEEGFRQFLQLRETIFHLGHELIPGIVNTTILGENPKIQKSLKSQPEKFSAAQTVRMIELTYPGLKGQIERLFDSTVQIQKERLEHLNHHQKDLNKLFSQYRSISNKINTLEDSLYNPSMLGKFFEKRTKTNLEKANEELRVIYNKIKVKGNFIPDERRWLTNFADRHLEHRTLSMNVTKMDKTYAYLEARNEVANHLNKLTNLLRDYKAFNRPDRMVRPQETLNILSKDISIEMEEITTLLHSDAAQKISKVPLPPDFENLTSLEQFKILTKMTFPLLDHRIDHIVAMIEDNNVSLGDKLEGAIKVEIPQVAPLVEEPKEIVEIIEEPKTEIIEEPKTEIIEEPKITEEVNTAEIPPEPPPLASPLTATEEPPPPLPPRTPLIAPDETLAQPTQAATFVAPSPPPPPEPPPTAKSPSSFTETPIAPPPPEVTQLSSTSKTQTPILKDILQNKRQQLKQKPTVKSEASGEPDLFGGLRKALDNRRDALKEEDIDDIEESDWNDDERYKDL